MGKFIDLTNQHFGRLTVVSRAEDYISSKGQKEAQWICRCQCGNFKIVRGSGLRYGDTKSCGCLSKESSAINGKKGKRYNKFVFRDSYIVGITNKGDQFYVDLDDYEKVKDICWNCNGGYLTGKKDGKRVKLHRLIMGLQPSDKEVVDHINHNTLDNRKSNLRIVTRSQNSMNRIIRANNKTGITGVYYSKKESSWIATISVNKINTVVGRFKVFEDAVAARKEAEKQYYKEYSYDNSKQYSLDNRIQESKGVI